MGNIWNNLHRTPFKTHIHTLNTYSAHVFSPFLDYFHILCIMNLNWKSPLVHITMAIGHLLKACSTIPASLRHWCISERWMSVENYFSAIAAKQHVENGCGIIWNEIEPFEEWNCSTAVLILRLFVAYIEALKTVKIVLACISKAENKMTYIELQGRKWRRAKRRLSLVDIIDSYWILLLRKNS